MVGRSGLHADGHGAQYSGNEGQGPSDKLHEPPGPEADMTALEADVAYEVFLFIFSSIPRSLEHFYFKHTKF